MHDVAERHSTGGLKEKEMISPADADLLVQGRKPYQMKEQSGKKRRGMQKRG